MDRNAATEKRERIMDGATLINRGGSPFVSNKDALVEGLIFRTNREYQICQAAPDLSLFFSLVLRAGPRQATRIMMHSKKISSPLDIFVKISRNVGFIRFEDAIDALHAYSFCFQEDATFV